MEMKVDGLKQSGLLELLDENDMLTQDARDYIDALMDDALVYEYQSGDETVHELMFDMWGWNEDRTTFTATKTWRGNIDAMAAALNYDAISTKKILGVD